MPPLADKPNSDRIVRDDIVERECQMRRFKSTDIQDRPVNEKPRADPSATAEG